MMQNFVPVSHNAQNLFVCYAYGPNILLKSPQPLLRANKVVKNDCVKFCLSLECCSKIFCLLCLWTQSTFYITLTLPQSQKSFAGCSKFFVCAMIMDQIFLLHHLSPSSEPKKQKKLIVQNVSHAAHIFFLSYAYGPNVPLISP